MELFKRKVKTVEVKDDLDNAIDDMVKEIRDVQDRIHDLIVNPPDDDEYDPEVLMDNYNKCGKLLIDLKRIKEENKKDDNIERKKIWIPVWVAIIGLGGTAITVFGNGRINIYIAKLLAYLEQNGTITTFPGRKWNWFVRK